jgi:hypothetical protein
MMNERISIIHNELLIKLPDLMIFQKKNIEVEIFLL